MELSTAIQLIETPHIYKDDISIWADLGCGAGLFTTALAYYLKNGSMIYAVDKKSQVKKHTTAAGVAIEPIEADFTRDDLHLPALDGLLMANALHYVSDKMAFLQQMKILLQPSGMFLIVEYDTDIPVPKWVPYPIRFTGLVSLFKQLGYNSVQELATYPSAFGSTMYAALIR